MSESGLVKLRPEGDGMTTSMPSVEGGRVAAPPGADGSDLLDAMTVLGLYLSAAEHLACEAAEADKLQEALRRTKQAFQTVAGLVIAHGNHEPT